MNSQAPEQPSFTTDSGAAPVNPATEGLSGRRFAAALAIICLAGLAARIVILLDYLAHNPFARVPIVDADTYWRWAGDIASGRLMGDTPFFSAPLYPYLLGALRALGADLAGVYGFQIILDVAAAAVLAVAARRRFGAATGLLSAALYLLLLDTASFSCRVLTCTVQLFLLALAWWTLIRVQEQSTSGRRAQCGVALGLLALAYPPAAGLAPAVALWLFVQSSRSVADALRALLPPVLAALLIAPATWHNYRASGDFFLIQSALGVNLRQGNAPDSTGGYTPIPNTDIAREHLFIDAARVFETATGRKGSWKEIDDYFRRQVYDFWRADPARTARLFARKAWAFLTSRHYGDIYQPTLEQYAGLTRTFLLAPLPTPWLIPLSVVALVAWLRRPIRFAPELALALIPLAVVCVFWYSPRYRLPSIPMIVVGAALALATARQWRTQRGRAIGAGAAVLATLALGALNHFSAFDSPEAHRARFGVSVGYVCQKSGDLDRAEEIYRRMLAADPKQPEVLTNLGGVLALRGKADEADSYFRQALALDPKQPQAHLNLGSTLVARGRLDEAIESMRTALEIDPHYAMAHAALGQALLAKNDEPLTTEALQHLRQALDARPDLLSARVVLAEALARKGDDEGALEQYRILETEQPDSAALHVQMATLLERLGRADEAMDCLKRALALDPAQRAARSRYAALLRQAGRYADAIPVIRDGLDRDPNDVLLANSLAWTLATCPDAGLRNGPEAVRLAEEVCRATQKREPHFLDTLAAALAEYGRFAEAVETAERAATLARQRGDTMLESEIRAHLELYRAGKAYHSGP